VGRPLYSTPVSTRDGVSPASVLRPHLVVPRVHAQAPVYTLFAWPLSRRATCPRLAADSASRPRVDPRPVAEPYSRRAAAFSPNRRSSTPPPTSTISPTSRVPYATGHAAQSAAGVKGRPVPQPALYLAGAAGTLSGLPARDSRRSRRIRNTRFARRIDRHDACGRDSTASASRPNNTSTSGTRLETNSCGGWRPATYLPAPGIAFHHRAIQPTTSACRRSPRPVR